MMLTGCRPIHWPPARMEHETGIRGRYYFRIVAESYEEQVIREIYALGHEIGYHYEV